MRSIRFRPLTTAALAVALLASPAAAGIAGADGTAPVWTLQAVPSPAHASGQLQSVSCPTTSWCMAVGSDVDGLGENQAMSETWNGTAWSLAAVPLPASATSSRLLGVSCTSATSCLAVGDTGSNDSSDPALVELWNGTSWTLTNSPAAGEFDALEAVSCVSSAACTAVGYAYTNSTEYPLAEVWNGKAMSVQSAARPSAAYSALDGVSCISATTCEAVGDTTATNGHEAPLAESWNGKTWALQTAPGQAGASSWLSGVSCRSASTCVAVGGYPSGPGGRSISDIWNGSHWTLGPSILSGTELTAVACTSTKSCEAVGNTDALVWNGTSWAAQKLPTGYPSDVLYGIACPSATQCTAIGQYSPAGNTLALAVRWNGTSWSALAAKDAWYSGATGPYAVSCSSSSSCAAVGGFQVQLPGFTTESWNGKSWALDNAQKPSNRPESPLDGVSCVAAAHCTAVGINNVIETWNGTSWSVAPTTGVETDYTSVSCLSTSFCQAVGQSNETASIPQQAVTSIWNGHVWTSSYAPAPASATSSQLTGVSCASSSSCVAVGQYYANGTADQLYGDVWNGTSWTMVTVPILTGSAYSFLGSVSCTSPTSCVAAGSEQLSGGSEEPFVETWNGTSWSIGQAASAPGVGGFLLGVSCASAASCLAVGGAWTLDYNTTAAIAEVWNGSTWSLETPAQPAGMTGGELDSVSCLSSGACTSFGSYGTATVYGLPFAETTNIGA